MHSIFGFLFRIIFLTLYSLMAVGQTVIDYSSVSGEWTKKNSPYIINTNIELQRGNSLRIEGGTRIEFSGNFTFSINGILTAYGTKDDSIYFTTTVGNRKWSGIEIIRNYIQLDDDSIFFRYTAFYNAYRSDGLPDEVTEAENGAVFYIKNYNRLKISYCTFKDNYSEGDGGVLFLLGGGESTEILYCRFENNEAVGSGGAIALNNNNALIFSNLFINNVSQYCGGAIFTQEDRSILSHNIFKQNEAFHSGGAIFVGTNSSPKIKKNIIQDNRAGQSGGAILAGFHSEPLIINNTIKGNTAQMYGGAIYIDDFCFPLIITNNLIHNNQAKFGGAIAIFNSQTSIYVNTIVKNRANSAAGIYIASQSPVSLSSNIIYYNNSLDSFQIKVKAGTNPPFIDFSCIQNGIHGIYLNKEFEDFREIWGNIISNKPLFIDTLNNDFRLKKISPCIDAGTTMYDLISIPNFDIIENPRIQNKLLDIGAYEYENQKQ